MRVNKSMKKPFLTTCCLLMAGVLSAATLNVDLTVTHGVCSDGGEESSRKVVFLVVDRSGSMISTTRGDGRKPNDVLVESLQLQLESIPAGTEMHVILFSSKVGAEKVFKSLDGDVRKQIVEYVTDSAPKGCTLWYDAQDLALSKAAKIMDADANAEVRVLVYSDGVHETPLEYKGEYRACTMKWAEGFRLGRPRKVNNPKYNEELAEAERKFKERFGNLIAKPNFELEREWLSDTDRPDESMHTKTVLPADFSSAATCLRNPIEHPDQTLKGSLHLLVSDKCWEELRGKPISVDFEVGGQHATKLVALTGGLQRCSLIWPLLPQDRAETARIAVSGFPEGRKFQIKDPKPLVLDVPAQGRVSVSVVRPTENTVVALGRDVRFEAQASDQATVGWTVGASKSQLAGSSVSWKADAPGLVHFVATASRPGMKSATAEGDVEVIRTGVEVMVPDERHEVGKETVFRAKAVGPCQRYAWTVDRRQMAGESADTLAYTFTEPGEHQVAVTAFYKGDITADSPAKAFAVARAPFLKVVSPRPYDGEAENTFQAEKPIDLSAEVDGDLTEVVWAFALNGKPAASFPMTVKDGRASGGYTPPKGGCYDLTVTARGPGGEKVERFQVFVKSADVRIDITHPEPNDIVETGKAFDLRAKIKGEVKKIRWRIIDGTTAKKVTFGPTDESTVSDGEAKSSAKLPLELGNTSVVIEAEPVFADADGGLADEVEPSSVAVTVKTVAEIAFTAETLGLNGSRAKYGEHRRLAATTTGAIRKVAWFMRGADGKVCQLEGKTGLSVDVKIPVVRGRDECPIDFYVCGLKPDGTWTERDEQTRITIAGYCSCGLTGIQLPKGTDGIVRRRFGLGESFAVELGRETGAPKPEFVEWSFGDGTPKSRGLTAEHAYRRAGTNLVVCVKARCSVCGLDFSDAETVACGVVPPRADFEIRNYSFSATCGSQIELDASKCTGDVADYIWTVDGQELKGYRGKKTAYVKCGRKPSDLSVCLTVAAPAGYQPEVPSCQKPIRVRFGWWAVAVFLILFAILAYILWKIFGRGNGPAGWMVYAWTRKEPHANAHGSFAKEGDFDTSAEVNFKLYRYWNIVRKRASVPLEKLSDDFGTANPGVSFSLEADANGLPDLQSPAGLEDVTRQYKVGVQNGLWKCYRLRRETKRDPKYMRVVVTTETSDMNYALTFWTLTLVLLALCFVACRMFAI